MADPNFWSDRAEAQARSEELANVKREVARWEGLVSDLGALQELIAIAGDDAAHLPELTEQARALERILGAIETEKRFSGPYDYGNAVLSLFAGAGGKDSEDWAAMLRRMYERWAEKNGYKKEIIHEHWGEFQGPSGWGIKNASILIKGKYAYGYLKKETGVHRLVRVSPFSAQSLRHTSFALAEVMPEFVKPEEIEIKTEEIKIDFFRSSGPGGQNVNKRETAVRITHIPTGLQAASQAERSQDRNREIAMNFLRSKLYDLALKHQAQEQKNVKQEKVSIEWSSQIRSHVMHPYQMVKDHRTDVETSQIDKVLDGELDEFIEAEMQK